jgi:hypothetical protein
MHSQTDLLQAIMKEMPVPVAGSDPSMAEAAVRVWDKVATRFRPVVGPATLALLFARSIDAHRASYPWLAKSAEPQALALSFAGRDAAEVAAATGAVLDSFATHMASLIGARLTYQFLRVAFPAEASPANSQEKSQ